MVCVWCVACNVFRKLYVWCVYVCMISCVCCMGCEMGVFEVSLLCVCCV